MALNYIWISFFVIALIVACIKAIFVGDLDVFSTLVNASFEAAKTAFEISLGLTGVLSLWMGLMKIGENAGVIQFFSRLSAPIFQRLFPDLPKNHPATGSIFMNLSANMLGLDNAATPLGLKAMQQMQELNPDKDRASNPMIMFLALNTSGLTLIPISVMVYRAQMGAANPADVFLPILMATYFSTLAAIFSVGIRQRINFFNRSLLLFFGALTLLIGALIFLFLNLPKEQINTYSQFVANLLLMLVIVGFLLAGVRKKINVYEAFIDGAKDGFKTAVSIIPYLIAILVGIGVFRASGAMDALVQGISYVFMTIGINADFVAALPTALMKPLSGSGARGMMVDAMKTYGADSFVGRLSSTIQGSTDTTFYILAVYFGSVGIKHIRYALSCGLFADMLGIIAAIFMAYLFFG
ncbi:MAG: nucleoside recognition domain-containing protein [Bacteroidales bacterium]